MNTRRHNLLNSLEAAAAKTPLLPEDFLSISFQILYGLPADLQFQAAIHLCGRYLPIYEKKLPSSAWVRLLLADLGAWFHDNRDATPDLPDESDSADALYHAGFTNLLVGYHHRDDPACLTAGVCGTMIHVIHARAQHVFLADDPVVIELEKEDRVWWDTWGHVEEERWPPQPDAMLQLAQPEHNPFKNVAFDAVYRREWMYVAGWMRAQAVDQYPEPEDLDAMTRGQKRWEAREFCPMGPEGL